MINELFPEFPKNVRFEKTEQAGFSIDYKDGESIIRYGRKCDLFRAAALLNGKLQSGACTVSVSETPKFDTLGVMIDVSRGAVLKVETVKDVMRTIAKMGYNRMMLYTEDTFLVDTYPYFGYMRGAYTEEELKEIVSYGEKLGIECVPCIETLSHKVWLRNNKPQGLEVIDFRLGGMESRIATAKMRVEAILAGEIESIPELEEERKPFAAPGRSPDFPLFSFFGSAQIFTASNL